MSPESFVAFLNGVILASPTTPPTPAQWAEIVRQLNSVFTKVTPDRYPKSDPTMRDETTYCAGPRLCATQQSNQDITC